MEFDEVVVKESPGLCRCCLSEGCYKDLGSEYSWMGDTEIYADMLLECFDIGISQHAEGPNGPNRLICEVCITRLRDSCNFKKQVLDSEKRFIDMLHRGEFRSKAAAAELPVMKQEAEALEVEYLDDLDFGDDGDDQPKTDTEPEQETQPEDITVTTLPMKRGRGRPRKSAPEKPERRAKVAKVEQPKASKAPTKGATGTDPRSGRIIQREGRKLVIKTTTTAGQWVMTPFGFGEWKVRLNPSGLKSGDESPEFPTRLAPDTTAISKNTPEMRQNVEKVTKRFSTALNEYPKAKINILRTFSITTILESSTVIPFKYKQGLFCFYCDEKFHNMPSLRCHTLSDHKQPMLLDTTCMNVYDRTVNADVTKIICMLCEIKMEDFNCLIEHLKSEHGKRFDDEVGLGVIPFKMADGDLRCAMCDIQFEHFTKLEEHMNSHFPYFACDTCGVSFVCSSRLKTHLKVHDTPFPCEESDATFPISAAQNRARDRKARFLMCDMCSLTFPTYRALKEHSRSVHDSKMPQFDCPESDMEFETESLMTETSSHDQKGHLQCPICDLRLFDNTYLEKHVHTKHIRGTLYACDYCPAKFVTGWCLRKHILKHNKITVARLNLSSGI